MAIFLLSGLAWASLLAGLSLTVFAPELANDMMLVIMLLALVHLFFVPGRIVLLRHPAGWMPLAAGALMLLAFSLTARSPLHVVAVLAFVHLFLVVPLAGLLRRLGPQLTMERVAGFALLGAAGGAVIAVTDVYIFGAERAGLVNNPIHLADLSLMAGFVALVGLWSAVQWRWLFLLGPVFSLVTVLLTGSQGPLLAYVALLMVAGLSLAFSAFSRRRVLQVSSLVAAVLVTGGVAGLAYAQTQSFWPLSSLVADGSTNERLIMYRAAFDAFVEQPLTGYGLLDYYAAAKAHMPADVPFPDYAHLHNDIADFAVAGGVLGLAAYGFFLFAPIAGALQARGPLRMPLLYLGGVTTTGYFAMGMTNAMLGLRWQNIVLATILAVILALSTPNEDALA